ncbi:MAG: TetR/AcrR family transcriptional regulator [Planctomycetaceae bacterium]|jgi:AcrR family transcriptional regulator|nr:TetR/AcrR family transcriptional regulator [Planctomycetaceae bacterium]
MTIPVDHEQRRIAILETAFELFAADGYGGVTYQKIADGCDIARTSIYRYFKSKEEIFTYAIILTTNKLTAITEKVLERTDWTAIEKITRIMHITVRLLADNKVFLTVVLDYALTQKQTGNDIKRRVRRHTFGMKYILYRLLKDAAQNEEVKIKKPEIVSTHLYSFLESFVLNLTVTNAQDTKDCLESIDSYIESIKNGDT